MKKKAIIIGAGPAGLTAAYELLQRTDYVPVVLELEGSVGGLSKTINHNGNRIDIGGHRFFSKSKRVMDWWLDMLPLAQLDEAGEIKLQYQGSSAVFETNKLRQTDEPQEKVMLLRPRKSRIYFLRRFFNYPISLSWDTLQKLGAARVAAILFSYTQSRLFPIRHEVSLEDFFINRFGKNLYLTFFKDYTEKVWGVPCSQIPAEWGAQRIKDLSVREAIRHAAQKAFGTLKKNDLSQQGTSTSLIEQFLYPKLGPGQLWEEVANRITRMGGTIIYHRQVTGIEATNGSITRVNTKNTQTGEAESWEGNLFFSTMPIRHLMGGLKGLTIPQPVKLAAEALQYRDFLIVGLLVKKFSAAVQKQGGITDNWIYIQEKTVKLGRLQVFNNWSPFMVAQKDSIWLGLEYFCNKGDELWEKPDADIIAFAARELASIGLIEENDVANSTVARIEKAYPAYFGGYDQFPLVKDFLNTIPNLYCIGRNGMHRYNNADHSMLTAMTAVDNIVAGLSDKENIWQINTEQDYHETHQENTKA